MKFFKNCESIEELKKAYKKLAFELHPDCGGSNEMMQLLNQEYKFALANIATKGNYTSEEVNTTILDNEAYIKAINALAGLPLVVELVGNWIWVTGNTRAYKDILKNNGFYWASKKLAWYFRTSEFKTKNYKHMDISEIKSKYGSSVVNPYRSSQICN